MAAMLQQSARLLAAHQFSIFFVWGPRAGIIYILESQGRAGARPLILLLLTIHEHEHHNGSFQVSFLPELAFSVIPLRSNAPPYSPRRDAPQAGDNIGLMVRDRKTGTSLFYAPGLGELTPELLAVMAQADCLLVDGTFWSEDEMRLVGLSHKQARDLGHLPLEGKDGMIELLAGFPAARKIFIHINNLYRF